VLPDITGGPDILFTGGAGLINIEVTIVFTNSPPVYVPFTNEPPNVLKDLEVTTKVIP
jgi:hypothetical protein